MLILEVVDVLQCGQRASALATPIDLCLLRAGTRTPSRMVHHVKLRSPMSLHGAIQRRCCRVDDGADLRNYSCGSEFDATRRDRRARLRATSAMAVSEPSSASAGARIPRATPRVRAGLRSVWRYERNVFVIVCLLHAWRALNSKIAQAYSAHTSQRGSRRPPHTRAYQRPPHTL